MNCKNCIWYNDENSYKSTGYCDLQGDYVNENDVCGDWEEEE